jgi:hypothetical protein
MNRVDGQQLYLLGKLLTGVSEFLGQAPKYPIGAMGPALIGRLGELHDPLRSLELRFSLRQIGRVEAMCREPDQLTEGIVQEIDILVQRIHDELETVCLLMVPPDRVNLWEQVEPPFGPEVDAKFPSAADDISEAGKCLALGRATACVSHLMRVLEIGLRSLSAVMGLPMANPNWATQLDQIEKAIRGMGAATHGPDWKVEQQFRSEAAAHFRLLKDAWRNHAMHSHARYDVRQAMEIWQSVQAFMRHLATRLSE